MLKIIAKKRVCQKTIAVFEFLKSWTILTKQLYNKLQFHIILCILSRLGFLIHSFILLRELLLKLVNFLPQLLVLHNFPSNSGFEALYTMKNQPPGQKFHARSQQSGAVLFVFPLPWNLFIRAALTVFLCVCQRDARERFVFVFTSRPWAIMWRVRSWALAENSPFRATMGRERAHRRVRLINVQTSVSGQEIMAAVLSFRPARWLLQSKQHSHWIKPHIYKERPTAKKYHPCVWVHVVERPQKFNTVVLFCNICFFHQSDIVPYIENKLMFVVA